MTYERVQDLKPEAFKRLCGSRPETFAEMVTVLEAKARQKRQPGRHWSLATSVLAVSISFWTFIWDYSTLEGASFGIGEQRHTSRCN